MIKLDYFPVTIEKKDAPHFGGKALNLAYLKNAGIQIPSTWVLPYDIPLFFLKNHKIITNKETIEKKKIKLVRHFFQEAFFNTEDYCILKKSIEAFCQQNHTIKRYAIRSSNSLEDGTKNSFSGLFNSYLNLSHAGDIAKAIVDCWASSFDDSIISYMDIINRNELTPCSVILQDFIPSSKSGVLFKTNDEIHINSNWGIATSIVDGTSSFDEWVINLKNGQITERIACKSTAELPIFSRVNPRQNEEITYFGIPNYIFQIRNFCNDKNILSANIDKRLKKIATLNKKEIKILCATAKKISKKLKIPLCDIEWTFKNNSLYILQIRPITAIPSFHTDLKENSSDCIKGIPLVKGTVIAQAFKIETEQQAKNFPKGSILIAKKLEGFTLGCATKASGCILASRSPLSHSAIIAREIGIPAIGSVDISLIQDSKYYSINGNDGSIKLVNQTKTKNFSNNSTNMHMSKKNFFDTASITEITRLKLEQIFLLKRK